MVDAVDHLGEVAREDAQLVPPLGARQAHDLAHVDLVLLDVLLQRLADARELHDGRGDGAGKEHRDDQGDKADHHRDEGDGAHDVVSLGVEDGVVRDGADHADAVALDEDGVGEIGARPLRLRVQGEGGKAAARKADVAEVVLDEDRGVGRGEHLPVHGEGGRGVARRAGDLLHEVLGDGGKALLVVVLLAEDEHLLDVDQAVVLHRDQIVVDVALVALGNVLGDEEVHDQEHGKEDGQHVQRHLDTDGQADLRSARKEPLQGEGGINLATQEFMEGIRKICDENGILMICDEVQCGMGRTGSMFAWQGFGVKPDILTMAKAIGNGIPVGAFAMTEEVAKYSLQPGDHGATYGGNPLACTAVKTVIKIFERDHIVDHVNAVAPYLTKRLDELVEELDCVTERKGKGLMQGIVVTKPLAEVNKRAIEEGILIIQAQGNVIRFVPPLIVEEKHIDEMIEKLKRALA